MGIWIFWLGLASFSLPAQAGGDLPPEFLFHVGKKSALQEDAKAGTIPPEAWEKFIMGRDTRYGLTPYRRGLYGGESFDGLELYGNLFIGQTEPWVMKIHLKAECRKPEVVTSIYNDPRYGEWLATHVTQFFGAASACLNHEAAGCADLVMGQNSVAYGAADNPCDGLLEQYLTDVGAKVVQDSDWDNSWYIRDRICVESLKASPDEVLKILAEDANWDQASRQHQYSATSGYGVSPFEMMASALSESPGPSPQILKELRSKLGASDIRISFEGSDAENPAWVKTEGPKVLDAYERCQRTGALAAFRKEADQFAADQAKPDPKNPNGLSGLAALAPVQSFTARLGKICGS